MAEPDFVLPSFRVDGRLAAVTGASRGLGRAIAIGLAAAGADVAVTDIKKERIEAVVPELRAQGAKAMGYVVDHSKFSEVQDFALKFESDFERVDILCCNAGVAVGGRFEELTLEDWEFTMSVNLWAAIYMLNLFLPGMMERKHGKVLITASGAGLTALPALTPYTTSKFAMVGLAESLGIEMKQYNINVTALCPGIINTNLVRESKIILKDKQGVSQKEKFVEFYATKGVSPDRVAKDAMKALAKGNVIKTSPPSHVWPGWLVKRISARLYKALAVQAWKKTIGS